MKAHQKNESQQSTRALDQELIDRLYKDLTKELEGLIKELNDSSKIGAFGAMATISQKVSDIAGDLKKLQHLPTMLTNPFVMADPRNILDEISRKYSKKKKK
ncbi:MAG: hypothetical protein A3B68_02180 [Candidatus Melainabacteria bacterium RIFCSPHIGHO2_02_FULL_34_12]|nr:MAG: hypothetical protein A3B68_02180 [Candidatus Melainabacteria bacterium RIFCSPHIGHO2_02_FULL_34_12]